MTIPQYLDDTQLWCRTAAQPFTQATEVGLEIALNDRDYVAVTPDTALNFTYFVQPFTVTYIHPTGGRVDGGTVVTLSGSGFEAYASINVSDVRVGWGDTSLTNLTTPSVLTPNRIVVASFPQSTTARRNMSLALNAIDLYPLNVSFLYYEQPTNYTLSEPTGGPTRGGTSVTIQGGPFDVFSTDPRNTLCRFGLVNFVAAQILERHMIVCTTPPAAQPGVVSIALSFNGAQTDFEPIAGFTFEYYQQPRPKGSGAGGSSNEDFVRLSPVGGPKGGGTVVTIVGSGFLAFSSSLVRCRWQAPIVDVLAASLAQTLSLPPPESEPLELTNRRIVCLAPPARVGAAETVNLTLSLNAIDFGATGLLFQYYDNPYVARIIPSGVIGRAASSLHESAHHGALSYPQVRGAHHPLGRPSDGRHPRHPRRHRVRRARSRRVPLVPVRRADERRVQPSLHDHARHGARRRACSSLREPSHEVDRHAPALARPQRLRARVGA